MSAVLVLAEAIVSSWKEWQVGVMSVLRADFGEVLKDVREDDVDWEAWRPLFEEGRSPKSAVDRAFLRDL